MAANIVKYKVNTKNSCRILLENGSHIAVPTGMLKIPYSIDLVARQPYIL